jgi:D-alanyl-D-alanine carboxypeptidase/D-alanyl-D-alanine-endopeptidase (penicillin-binding protein 4)
VRRLAAAEKEFSDHTGFVLYDPGAKKTLIEFNSGKYFTPASNTKIFTFYTALQILGDSVPGLKYVITNDSLIFWGTGDPSFLYQKVHADNRVYDFLKYSPHRLFFSSSNFQTEQFGPGWAWDDYQYAYSPERCPFPIFGNSVEIVKEPNDHLITSPSLFSEHLLAGDSIAGEPEVIRDVDSNQLTFYPGRKRSDINSWILPFHYSSDVIAELLSDTLNKQVDEINFALPNQAQMLFSIPVDSLYRVMMQDSNNFIAEQLLLMCAGVVSDTLKPEVAIRYARKNFLFDLPDEPVWVDGSGLSRYNLFTPRSIARLWEKIDEKVPRERLFKLLAAGGQSGTLKNGYQADVPFVFGKTGSLSNNQTLSGFVVTRRGTVLIFSFMNANFIAPTNQIRKMMEEVLVIIRNKY